MYLVMVYYRREPFAEGPGTELWSAAETEAEAVATAESASRENPAHEFAVEGGHYENGGWDNPLFRDGRRMR